MLPCLKNDAALLHHLTGLTKNCYETWKTVLDHDPQATTTLDVLWECHERYQQAEHACWQSWVDENLPKLRS